jgi:multidrug resistance efflux pump
MNRISIQPVLISAAVILLLLSGCDTLSDEFGAGTEDGTIQASGMVEAQQVSIASELSGRIAEVLVSEGEQVQAGDPIFRLENEVFTAQLEQARAAYDSTLAQQKGARAALSAAEAALVAAEQGLLSAAAHFQLVLNEALAFEAADRVKDWNRNPGTEIDLPAWYFMKSELIRAAEVEVENARDFIETEEDRFAGVIRDVGSKDIISAEERLANAQAAFAVVESLQDRDTGYTGREELNDFVQILVDSAEAELEAAQNSYDQLLSDPDYEEILEARARVAVARERYALAQDALNALLTGEDSLVVIAAQAGVSQAESAVSQAEAQIILTRSNLETAQKAIQQAQLALDLANLQLDKLTVYAPIAGTVLTRTIEKGEILQAGLTAMTIGILDDLTITVYISENLYGQIKLGDQAKLSFDSFPDVVFTGEVIRIADQAEFTPRNVQTKEERQNTVYAVKLTVDDPDLQLKPGMPADVVFNP